ncbi:MAG: EscU/YscU/HrcU family type III secretion system export apparatus switch protein [Methyloligellaceae bacterium]
MSGGSSEEKKHTASDTKLRKEREKGRIAKSQDLHSSVAGVAGILLISQTWNYYLKHINILIDTAIHAANNKWEDGFPLIYQTIINELALLILPVFGIIVFSVILSNLIYNKGLPISFEPIKPQLNKLNPAEGFKNIFGKKALIGTGQTLVRLILLASGAVAILWISLPNIINSPLCGLNCFLHISSSLTFMFLSLACLIFIIVALMDMPIQKALFLKEQKMGDSEKKRENKDMFGSPEIRSARHQLQNELNSDEPVQPGQKRLASIVILGKASAIAIYYNPEGTRGPSVMASAKGEKLRTILEQAGKDGVPVHKDDTLAKKISSTPVGSTIPPRHYAMLATAMIKSGVAL